MFRALDAKIRDAKPDPPVPLARLLDQPLWLPIEVKWRNVPSGLLHSEDPNHFIDTRNMVWLGVAIVGISVAIVMVPQLPLLACIGFMILPLIVGVLLGNKRPIDRETWLLDQRGLSHRRTGHPTQHTPWADLSTRVEGSVMRVYGADQTFLFDTRSFNGVERIALSLIVGLAHQRLPVWKQQLWAGEMVDFDGLRLGLTRVELVARGQVIERKDVGLWRTEAETLLFHDRSGGVVGTVPISDLLNPDLLWELLEEWGMDTANPTPVEDVIITGRTPHDTTP